MLYVLFLLPLADSKTVLAPPPKDAGVQPDMVLSTLTGVGLVAVALGLLIVGFRLWVSLRKRPAKRKNWILVDGSNVMHWQDNTPLLAPLLQVIADLKERGFAPGVVFDANVGYKLSGKHLNEHELSQMLSLPVDQLLVVPKGEQADEYIIETALKFGVPIVTNDRFSDWAEAYPKVAEPGFLVWGGIKDGEVWLRYPNLSPDMPANAAATAG